MVNSPRSQRVSEFPEFATHRSYRITVVTRPVTTLLVPTLAIVFTAFAPPAVAQTKSAVAQTKSAVAQTKPAVAQTKPVVAQTKSAVAQSQTDRPDQTDRPGSPDRAIISQAETKVWRMVREHLPELRPMLQRLQADAPAQYRRAIIDLARSARRLEAASRRDQTLYEIEVETLQAKTDVNLAVARLKVRDRQADRNALRKAVMRVHQAEQRRAEYEVELLEQRRKRVESQLAEAREQLQSKRSDTESAVDSNFETMLRRAGRGTKD